jgi:hypothetical protein
MSGDDCEDSPMGTAASNGKTAQSVAAGGRVSPGGSVDKPAAKAAPKAKPKMTAEQQKHYLVIGIALAVVAGVGALIFGYFYKAPTGGAPRLNEPPAKIVSFINTNDFDKLDFDRKKLYMIMLAGKKKEIIEMEKSGQMNRKQLEDVLAVVWLGKQFKHVEKYNSLGALDRKDMLDEMIDEDKMHPHVKTDPEANKKRVKELEETFPAYERQQIAMFRQALKEREKERKNEDRQIKKTAPPAHSTTSRPAARVGDAPASAHPAVIAPK